jgi:flagellar biosynthetic protein FliP
MKRLLAALLPLLALLWLDASWAQAAGLPAVTVEPTAAGGQSYTLSLQILAVMTALTMLPAALLMTTSFTRIIIVLSILRQAIGTAQTPSNQVLLGLALFLTLFVMTPVFQQVYQDAIHPYMDEQISDEVALEKAALPLKDFMLGQTREKDIALFAGIAGEEELESPSDTPFSLLLPAFITSELKTAFQIGFIIFIPFIIIDLVVASVLMSMGMMMLSPMIISAPFKIMLFVLVDGWSLVMGTLAASFYTS